MTAKDQLIESLINMKKYGSMSFWKVIKESVSTIKPSKTRIIILIFITLIIEYPIIQSVLSNNTLDIFKEIVNFSNNSVIAIFSVIFTGYALFQALINKNTLKVMFLTKPDKNVNRNLFIEYNLYFLVFSVLCVLSIILNFIILIYIPVIKEFSIMLFGTYENFVSILIINLYFIINIYIILEVKCFLFNLFRCFNISAISTMIDDLSNYDDDLHEKQ